LGVFFFSFSPYSSPPPFSSVSPDTGCPL
jgi:hypothetical protein